MTRPDPDRMIRTTVYFSGETMNRARVAAAARGVTVAAIVRSALDSALGSYRPPPTGGFLSGSAGGPGSAGRSGGSASAESSEPSDL